jgi:hypothetical protein
VTGPCWLLRANHAGGYAQTHDGRLAHRAVWEALHGPLSPALVLHHLCGNKACVNPAHLEPLTNAEHARLHRTGHRSPTCKRGHDLNDPANVLIDRKGKRHCRACAAIRQAKFRSNRRTP